MSVSRRPPSRPARARPRLGLLPAWVAWCADWLLRLVGRTSSTIEVRPEWDLDRQGVPVLVVTLHQGLLYMMHHFRDRGGVVMASRSRDGDFVTAVLSRLGYRVARGSDSKGGAKALDEMITLVRDEGLSAALTCDGPRGPYGSVKMGILKLARDTGRPIVPCGIWMSRKKLLSNWDRTLVPLPFSRIALCFGEPIEIAPGTPWLELKGMRDELETRIAELIAEAQRTVGQPAS